MSKSFTVMGPAPTAAHVSYLTPPKLTPETDKYQWRVDVKTWTRMVKLYAKGGDSRAKGMLNALALTLYFSLERDQRNIVDNAMQDSLVPTDMDDDTEECSINAITKIQFQRVDEIVNLVAKDTPTDGIRRMVRISQDIHKCVRITNEKPNAFARKFQGLAKQYLNMCNSADGGRESQNFAVLLLENAKLPSSTFNNIVTQLVTKSTSKHETPRPVHVGLPITAYTELLSKSEAASEAASAWESTIMTSPTAHTFQTYQLLSQTRALIETTKDIAEVARRKWTDSNHNERPIASITLDDAVDAICDIKADEDIITTGASAHNSNLKREQDATKHGAMMMKRREMDNSSLQPQRKKPYILPGTGKKKDSTCVACKKIGHWKVKGSVVLQTDPNPIIDEGAPTSTGGINNAATICDLLGIQLSLDPPRENYEHGWGQDCHDARPILASWTLTIMDIHGHPIALTFDLVRGDSPLIIGLDVTKFANIFNTKEPRHMEIQRPTDIRTLSLHTYVGYEGPYSHTQRLRAEIIPHARSSVTTLMANINTLGARKPLAFSKKLHRFTHAPADEIKNICRTAGILDGDLSRAIDTVDRECELCAKNGRPASTRKISLTFVNAAFNLEVQVDFTHCTIRGEKHTLINMTDRGTGWSEVRIVDRQNIETMKQYIECDWLCIHGAPRALSADDAYDKPEFHQFLKQHNIQYRPRPARRHNKLGAVERKNRTVKAIIQRLDCEITNANADTILARAVFLSNLFSGSRKLSSFQLTKGYTPSLLGIPSSRITPKLLEAHKEQAATRALQTLLHSKNPNHLHRSILKAGDPIWVYYETSSKAKKKGWVKATVVEAQDHRVLARRSMKGPPMRAAYEDIRVAPNSELTQELMALPLEDELATDDSDAPIGHAEAMHETARDEDSLDRGGDDTSNPITQHLSTSHVSPALLANTQDSSTAPEGENPIADIGKTTLTQLPPPNATLESDRARILENMSATIGKEQVTRGKLNFAPSWIVEEAFNKEYSSNWEDAYDEVDESAVPLNANVISSHVVYKIKTHEDGSHALKARIVPHGNRDIEKDDIRKDSSTAQFDVIRILLAVCTFLGMRLAMADIKGAYLQSGPIKREIFVRPPREWVGKRGQLWKLKKLPYGIVEAGRQWAKTVEEWMLTTAGLERLRGLNQLYVKRDSSGKIVLIVAKVTDDFICGGAVESTTAFIEELKKRFEVGKVVIDGKFLFNGCEIEQDAKGSIRMSMRSYMSQLEEIALTRERRKQPEAPASTAEITAFRSLAGTLLWLGKGVLPPAAYASSTMQQKISMLKVGHLLEANDIVRDIKKLEPQLLYHRTGNVTKAMITTFSDASFNITSRKSYGQTGLIMGVRTTMEDGSEMFHMLDWVSTKQRRISHSSYGAEILACAEGDDRGYYLKEGMRSLFPRIMMRNEIAIDSKGLYDTITTLHEGNEYRLRQTVQRIRDSFEAGDVNIIRWLPGTSNIADALTKRNPVLWKILNDICTTGRIDAKLLHGFAVDGAEWK